MMRRFYLAHVSLLACSANATAASISVNSTTVNNLDWIRATFTFTPGDSSAWVGLFGANQNVSAIDALPYPATAPWTANAPIKYVTVESLTSADVAAGTGFWEAELINGYASVVFWLFTGGVNAPKAVASSSKVSFSSYPPLRGHVGGTGLATELRVVWHSALATDAGASVRYGPSPDSLSDVAPATGTSYSAADLCGPPATTHGWWSANSWFSAGA
jgi:acid phosphatase type 7